MPQKIFIIACETSGDHHAARLVAELRRQTASGAVDCLGLGGPEMQKAGVSLIEDMTRHSALGLGDVIRQYGRYQRIFNGTLDQLKTFKPDALILVDSPAFNLRFAKKAKLLFPDLPVFYYICPQIWAWGYNRIHTIKKTVSRLFSIFPFETNIYKKAGAACEFVGHPLLEEQITPRARPQIRESLHLSEKDTALAFLPGSRQKEVERILPMMLETACHLSKQRPDIRFFLSCSANVKESAYDNILKRFHLTVTRFGDHFEENVSAMDFAFVASGTATLQTALLEVPLFVLYKASWTTSILGKILIRVPYIGIVNLLAGKLIAPEYTYRGADPRAIAKKAESFLADPTILKRMKEDFKRIREILEGRRASATTAKAILDFLQSQNSPTQIPVLK